MPGVPDARGAPAPTIPPPLPPPSPPPPPLFHLQNDILKAALAGTGRVGLLASEEDDGATPVPGAASAGGSGPPFIAVFDPLDGSSNIDASIPTGTIFGLHRAPAGSGPASQLTDAHALRPGKDLVASAYALYSSATMLVLALGRAGEEGGPAGGGAGGGGASAKSSSS